MLLLVGGITVVIDARISLAADAPPFDIVNDALGYALITASAFMLSGVRGPGDYPARMRFVGIVGMASVMWSLARQLEPTLIVTPLSLLFGALGIVAAFLLSAAMRGLSRSTGLVDAERWWGRSTIAIAVVWGGLWLWSALVATSTPSGADGSAVVVGGPGDTPGAWVTLTIVWAIAFAPGIVVAISILRTRRGLAELSGDGRRP